MKDQLAIEPLAVSVNEAAKMIGVCPRSVQNYIAENLLLSRKIGRRRVILVAALKDFLRRDHPSPSGFKKRC
jgi:hypothetical protein